MSKYRWCIDKLLTLISDPKVEDSLRTYLINDIEREGSEGMSNEERAEEEKRLRDSFEEVRSEMIDAFDERGRRYNWLAFASVVLIILNWAFSLQRLQEVGLAMSVGGSIILAIGVIHGVYWTSGLFVAVGYGNPSKFFRQAILNDTVDGVYGVLFIISGFVIQFIAVVR